MIPQKMEGDVRLGPLSFIRKNFMSYYEKGMRVHPLEFLNTVGGINMGKREMVDVSDWTDEDLKMMEKSIKKELSNRTYKSKCCVEDGIEDLHIWNCLADKGMRYNDMYSPKSALRSAIYKICDLTLGNYRVYETKTKSDHKLECLGSKLYDRVYDDYVPMVKELMDVVRKYDKKVNSENGEA